MTATLWWVRHGPTHAKTMVGWSDLPADLSDRAALSRLSAYLPDAPVVSSTLLRAVATADAIQGARPRLPHNPDLREMHFGTWELRSHTDIAAEDPHRIRAFWDEPGAVRPPGGESWDDLRARVDPVADALAAQGGDIIVVAHFGAILTQVQRAGDLDGEETFGYRIDNLSVTRLRFSGRWRADPINHLP